MKVVVHADDLGICASATSGIVDLHRRGRLDRVSVLPNGEAFEQAMSALKEIEGLSMAVHLNLTEGRPLSDPAAIPLLVDRRGFFRHSFLSLWASHQFVFWARRPLERQVERELGAQVERFRRAAGAGTVSVDSHQYVHLLPFVFAVLARHADPWGIREIRTVNEPLAFGARLPAGAVDLLSPNLLKHLLLNHLSRRPASLLDSRGIAHPDHFVGVFHSGRMTAAAARRSLAAIARGRPASTDAVELLFHPGVVARTDLPEHLRNSRRNRFYLSPRRRAEMAALLSSELKSCVSELEAGGA